jgi:hypothetical protein
MEQPDQLWQARLWFRHHSGESTLDEDMAFILPAGHGTVRQDDDGILEFTVPMAAATHEKAAALAIAVVDSLWESWKLPPLLPPRKDMRLVGAQERAPLPPLGVRIVVCSVCGGYTGEPDPERRAGWMSTHPDEHDAGARSIVDGTVQHYQLVELKMAEMEDLGDGMLVYSHDEDTTWSGPYTHWMFFPDEASARACEAALPEYRTIVEDPGQPGVEWLLRAERDVPAGGLPARHAEVEATVVKHGGEYDGGETGPLRMRVERHG